MRIGSCQLRLKPFELLDKQGQPVKLRNNSLSVLEILASKPYQLVSRDELLDRIWPDNTASDEGLSQCIRDIRKTIRDTGKAFLQTEYKRGYRLVPELHSSMIPPPPLVDYGTAVPYREHPEFRQNTGFTRSGDGVGIAYATSGKGTPVIRAPHWLSHLDWDWRCEICGPRIRRLSEGLHYIRFDSRGTGCSDRNVDPGGIKEWADDLHAVASATGHEKFALMGISGGAPTILRYTYDHPDKVSCLVLLGGFARGPLIRGVCKEEVTALAKLIETGWGTNNAFIRQVMTTQLWPTATKDQAASFNHLQQVSCDGRTAAKLFMNIANTDVTGLLSDIHQPVLIVHSKNDFCQPRQEAELMAEILPNASLCVLQTKNHTPMSHETEFDRMITEVTEFVVAHTDSEIQVDSHRRV